MAARRMKDIQLLSSNMCDSEMAVPHIRREKGNLEPIKTIRQEIGTVLEWRTKADFRVLDGFLSLKSPAQSSLPRPQQDGRL